MPLILPISVGSIVKRCCSVGTTLSQRMIPLVCITFHVGVSHDGCYSGADTRGFNTLTLHCEEEIKQPRLAGGQALRMQ